MKITQTAALLLVLRLGTARLVPGDAGAPPHIVSIESHLVKDSPIVEDLMGHPFPDDEDTVYFDASVEEDDEYGRRLQSTEYDRACANPAILYRGTSVTGRCACDDSGAETNSIVCAINDSRDCSGTVCTTETDLWLFDKGTEQLESRATCLVCDDATDACSRFENVCYAAFFDAATDEMTGCALLRTEAPDGENTCGVCAPCQEDGMDGMTFACFDLEEVSDGCQTEPRLGLHPFRRSAPSPSPASAPSPDGDNECSSQLEAINSCISASCETCLNAVQDGIFEGGDTVSCTLYEEQTCDGINNICTSACEGCKGRAEAFYRCASDCVGLDCSSPNPTPGTRRPTRRPTTSPTAAPTRAGTEQRPTTAPPASQPSMSAPQGERDNDTDTEDVGQPQQGGRDVGQPQQGGRGEDLSSQQEGGGSDGGDNTALYAGIGAVAAFVVVSVVVVGGYCLCRNRGNGHKQPTTGDGLPSTQAPAGPGIVLAAAPPVAAAPSSRKEQTHYGQSYVVDL